MCRTLAGCRVVCAGYGGAVGVDVVGEVVGIGVEWLGLMLGEVAGVGVERSGLMPG